MRGILIDREAGTIRRELEQHAARLLEVDRLEPEAIDYGRRMMPRRFDPRSHLVLMLLVVHAPREVMDAADAPRAAAPFGRLANVEHARRALEAVADYAVFLAEALEAEHVGDERLGHLGLALPHLRAVQPPDLPFVRHAAAIPGRERALRRHARLDKRHLESVRIDERQHAIAEALLDGAKRHAVLLQARSPEVEAAGRHFERGFEGEPVADARRRHLGPRKEGQIRSGMAFRIRVAEA